METAASRFKPVNVLDLYHYPEIVTKDDKIVSRVESGLQLAKSALGVSNLGLRDVLEERGRGLVNRVFFIDSDGDFRPNGVMLLIKEERRIKQSFERTVASYELLRDRLVEASYGICRVPKILGINPDKQILIIEPLEDNVSWTTPTPIVEGLFRSFVALSKIKPTEENRAVFPYEPIDNADTPEQFMKNVIEKRLSSFFVWFQKLEAGELGESESEVEEYKLIQKFIRDNNIIPRLVEARERVVGRLSGMPEDIFGNMPDVGLNTGDGNVLNFLTYVSDDGSLQSGNIDFDDARFGSISELVASAILHPQNRKLFGGSNGRKLRRQLVDNYIFEQGFSKNQIEIFNLYIDLYWLKWCATVAKNLSSGRSNWQQLYGGSYKTRAEFLLKKDLPLLLDMLKIQTGDLHVGNSPTYQDFDWNLGDIKRLTYPLTEKSPFGEFQIYVSEKVGNGDGYLKKINSPLLRHKLSYPYTKKEIFYDSNPFLLGKTKKVVDLGDGDFLVIHDFWSLRSKGDKGEYSYLTRSSEVDKNKGGLVFCVGEKEIRNQDIPKISIPKEILSKFIDDVGPDSEKRFRNLITTFGNLTELESEIHVTDLKIIRDVERFMSIVVATLNNGQRLTIKLNRENRVPEDSAGVVFVPRTLDGKYLLLRQRRMIIPSEGLHLLNSNETLEIMRGWISPDEQPLSEFAHESGLRAGYVLKEGASIAQDYRTDAVNLSVFLIEVDEKSQSRSHPQPNGTDEYHEELVKQELTTKETIEAIQKGIIRDNFSIYSIGLYMLRSTNELIVDEEKVVGKYIYLQKKFVLQEGGYRYSIPEGPKDTGRLISENLPNSASARQVDQVNEWDLKDLQKLNIQGLESVPVMQAIENIKDGVYDAPTAAALIVGFLNKGYIKYSGTL